MEKARRKEREFNLRRAEILDQAERIFSAKGFYNTTVAEIANASGFAIGTLYQFFESKERLYAAMVTEKLDRMYAGIRETAAAEPDILGKIEALVASQFRFVENNAGFCGIFIRGEHMSLSEGSEELRDRLMADYEEHVSFIEGVMREGIRAGILQRMDPRMMAAALVGIMNSCTFKWLAAPGGTALSADVPIVIDIFLGGVRKNAHG
jgi:AcrR family transcriptional regulator